MPKTLEQRMDEVEKNQFKAAVAIAKILIRLDNVEKSIGITRDKRDREKID